MTREELARRGWRPFGMVDGLWTHPQLPSFGDIYAADATAIEAYKDAAVLAERKAERERCAKLLTEAKDIIENYVYAEGLPSHLADSVNEWLERFDREHKETA